MELCCCIPGGSLMPEGVADIPASPAEQIVEKCRFLLKEGYDCTECAGGMLAELTEDEIAVLIAENEASPLKLRAVNSLFPGDWKLANPDADHAPYRERADKIFSIMEKLHIPYAVFGSGMARSLIGGSFRAAESRKTLYDFLRTMAADAGKKGIALLIEPLREKETNVFRTVPEAAEAIRELRDDNILLLYDAFHMAQENTDLRCVPLYRDLLRHCHVAESPNRTIPGSDDSGNPAYLQQFAGELLKMGYDGAVSVECGFHDFKNDAVRTLKYMKACFIENPVFEYTSIRKMQEEPVFLKPKSGVIPEDLTALSADGILFPASPYRDGVIAVLTAEKGKKLTLTAVNDASIGQSAPKAELDEKSEKVTVRFGNAVFADYVFHPDYAKPFFGPVRDNAGIAFTRLDLKTKEHPHQRSVFVAVGDVNGVDCWNETPNHGYVRNNSITNMVSGSAYASFTAHNTWTDHEDKPLLEERTTYTVYHQREVCRSLDLTITFTAKYGDVTFGPTKEAGPLGIRLRDELRADVGGGRMCNSWGGFGEEECWSRSAEWCDYYGEPEGIGPMGVTVFDCSQNERHPTAWHIRAYGLFAANNLCFKGGFVIPDGTSVTYRFRILFRRRAMEREELSDRYVLYTLNPLIG